MFHLLTKRLKNVLPSVLLFIAALFFAFLVAEVVVRLLREPLKEIDSVSDYHQFNIKYGIEPKPNLKYIDYGYELSTNKQAFYGPEIPLRKDGLRVAYLGDSYSIGPGIDFKENYPYLITKKLEERFGEVDFLIGGVGGGSPFQQKFLFEEKILPYKPDLVIYELYDNDVNDDFVFRYSTYYARMQTYSFFPEFLRNSRFVQQIILFVSAQLSNYYEVRYEREKHLLEDNPELAWDLYTKPALDQILQQTRKEGAKFVLFYLPSGWEFDNEYVEARKGDERSFLATAAREWAQANNVPYSDMYETFLLENTEKTNELYLPGERGYHLTPRAAFLVAQEVFKIINLE